MAAINVGVQGSADEVAATIQSATITVHVPSLVHARVVKMQHGALTETIRFVPSGDDDAGAVDVTFTMASGRAPKRAAVQVTANGVTTTVVSKTHQGLHTHFTLQ